MDAINRNDIETAFKGKLWTYTDVIREGQYGLGVAVSNEPGYSPVPFNMTQCKSYAEAKELAKSLNADRGQSTRASLDIVASTMVAQNVAKKAAKQLQTHSVKLESPAAVRAAIELCVAIGNSQTAEVMYWPDGSDDDLVGLDMEEADSMLHCSDDYDGMTPDEALEEFMSGRDNWELWLTK